MTLDEMITGFNGPTFNGPAVWVPTTKELEDDYAIRSRLLEELFSRGVMSQEQAREEACRWLGLGRPV